MGKEREPTTTGLPAPPPDAPQPKPGSDGDVNRDEGHEYAPTPSQLVAATIIGACTVFPGFYEANRDRVDRLMSEGHE